MAKKSSLIPTALKDGRDADILIIVECGRPRLAARLRDGSQQDVIDLVEEAAVLLDDQRRYVDVNRAAEELTRVPRAELLKRRFGGISGADPAEIDLLWKRVQASGMVSGSHPIRMPEGGVRMMPYHFWANLMPGLHLSLIRPA